MLSNQRGALEAPAIVLLFLLGLLLAVQIGVWHWRLMQTREHHRQVLCLKRSIQITNRLVRNISSLNAMIATGKVGQGIGLLFPGAGWVLALKWEKVKKLLMTLQEGSFLWAQAQWLQQRKSGCRLPLKWQLSPFEYRGRLSRELDLVVLRKTEETYNWRTPYMRFSVHWTLPHNRALAPNWSIE